MVFSLQAHSCDCFNSRIRAAISASWNFCVLSTLSHSSPAHLSGLWGYLSRLGRSSTHLSVAGLQGLGWLAGTLTALLLHHHGHLLGSSQLHSLLDVTLELLPNL